MPSHRRGSPSCSIVAAVFTLSLFARFSDATATCTPRLKWTWNGIANQPARPYTCYSPIVVELTDDNRDGRIDLEDFPDVVFPHCAGQTTNCSLVALEGISGWQLFRITAFDFIGNIAAGDLDGDGVVEIVAMRSDEPRLAAFRNDGTLLWTSDPSPPGFGSNVYLSIADLDQDGRPEILAGTSVFTADGRLKWKGTGGVGDFLTHAVDLDPASPGLEVLGGNTLYDSRGAVLWSSPLRDAPTAVADFDGDGEPEIVLATSPWNRDSEVYVLDRLGNPLSPPWVVARGLFDGPLSAPLTADLDGDGAPEIVFVRNGGFMTALHWSRSGFALAWTLPTTDSSGLARPVAFDFDGDGAAEIVYRDQDNWYLIDGRNGTILRSTPQESITYDEHPVVADLDHDCRAEILVSGCRISPPAIAQVTAWDCDDLVAPRMVWNQYDYHVTNVNADGTIPRVEAAPWTGPGWFAQSGDDARHPDADPGPPLTLCEGDTIMLDASGSRPCPGSLLEYQWSDGTATVCSWSSSPACSAPALASATWTLEVRCVGGRVCALSDDARVDVTVIPDVVPPGLGNTLRAVRIGGAVNLSWAGTATARTYTLHRATVPGLWPTPAFRPGLTVTSDSLADVAEPPRFYLYRVAGAGCSGREGP